MELRSRLFIYVYGTHCIVTRTRILVFDKVTHVKSTIVKGENKYPVVSVLLENVQTRTSQANSPTRHQTLKESVVRLEGMDPKDEISSTVPDELLPKRIDYT